MHLVHDHVLQNGVKERQHRFECARRQVQSYFKLLIIDRTEEDVGLERLPSDSTRKHVLAGVAEALLNEDLLHILDFRAAEGRLGLRIVWSVSTGHTQAISNGTHPVLKPELGNK